MSALLFLWLSTCCHLGQGSLAESRLPGSDSTVRAGTLQCSLLACLLPSTAFPEHLQGIKDCVKCFDCDNKQSFLPGFKEVADKRTGRDATVDKFCEWETERTIEDRVGGVRGGD